MNYFASLGRQASLYSVTLAIAAFFMAEAALAQTTAGIVKNVSGSALIVRGDRSLPAEPGSKLMAGDVVRTSAESSVGVMLKDETRLSVGSSSQAALEKFSFNADSHKGGMTVNVVKGTLSMISGLLVKANPGEVLVKTPTSTAGIRGTFFVVEVY